MIMEPIENNRKLITIKYDSIQDLHSRESAMRKSLLNNLNREKLYKLVDSHVSMKGSKFLLNFEIALID